MFFVTRLTFNLVGGSGGSEEEEEENEHLSKWSPVVGDCAGCCESALTDGVSGPSRISGDGERAKSKSVLSSDPEQVVLAFKKSWDHVGLAGTSGIDLKKVNQTLG